jgi:F0F1-type ATP synthase membrane subunit b/b'
MSTQEPERVPQAPSLTSLPRIEDLPVAEQGFDQQRVREAFEGFRRHALQLQAQLRVLQAAAGTSKVEPTAHAVRMDALHLIRAAAEFADAIERDAQNASAVQLARAEEEIRRSHHELQQRESEIDRFRQESDRQRADLVNQAKAEAREVLANAEREANQEIREAEARAARLLEQSRHQATELTNAARAEVEQTLEWARAQAGVVVSRAQQGAEQLLSAAGLGADEMERVITVIIGSTGGEEQPRAAEAAKEKLAAKTPASEPPPAARMARGRPSAPAEAPAEPESSDQPEEPSGGEPKKTA